MNQEFVKEKIRDMYVWNVTHFSSKYFPLTIMTFIVMFVLLCLNLYYFLNLFDSTNVKKVDRTRNWQLSQKKHVSSPLTFALLGVNNSLTLHQNSIEINSSLDY